VDAYQIWLAVNLLFVRKGVGGQPPVSPKGRKPAEWALEQMLLNRVEHRANDFVASSKRFVNILISANLNCCSDNFTSFNDNCDYCGKNIK